jgi:hypothetical protein
MGILLPSTGLKEMILAAVQACIVVVLLQVTVVPVVQVVVLISIPAVQVSPAVVIPYPAEHHLVPVAKPMYRGLAVVVQAIQPIKLIVPVAVVLLS